MDVETVEEYLDSLEQYFFSSVSTITAGFPDVHEAVNRLWVDISRYGPALPEVRLPTLGDFQVPPPPPPPPPLEPTSWLGHSYICVSRHPWRTLALVFGATGAGIVLANYAKAYAKSHRIQAQKVRNERRKVVVILGGDTPFALPLIQDLERKGYVVIASVSTPEACSALENECRGYVRALVLDPSEPATVNPFLRSLTSTLSLRFPLNAPGDPYATTSSQPYIHSVISLLTLSPRVSVIPSPLEHVSLHDTYIRYLTASQITPLRIIQCLLPLLRTSPRDKGTKTIIVCLPATEARVGVPFASVQSMGVASTLRATEVLRREINLASVTDKSSSMKNIKVVVAEVGALKCDNALHDTMARPFEQRSIADLYKSMEDWTASEKVSYGPAFAAIAHDAPTPKSRWLVLTRIFGDDGHFGVQRQPTDVSVFVNHIVDVVSDGRFGPCLFGLGFLWRKTWNIIRGERFSVGAGATTYKVASYLPPLILDTVLSLPAILISIRNRLLSQSNTARRDAKPPTAARGDRQGSKNDEAASELEAGSNASDRQSSENDEPASEWEAGSNASDPAEHSWIRLRHSQGGGNPWVP